MITFDLVRNLAILIDTIFTDFSEGVSKIVYLSYLSLILAVEGDSPIDGASANCTDLLVLIHFCLPPDKIQPKLWTRPSRLGEPQRALYDPKLTHIP